MYCLYWDSNPALLILPQMLTITIYLNTRKSKINYIFDYFSQICMVLFLDIN